jgi:hypothetical protein
MPDVPLSWVFSLEVEVDDEATLKTTLRPFSVLRSRSKPFLVVERNSTCFDFEKDVEAKLRDHFDLEGRIEHGSNLSDSISFYVVEWHVADIVKSLTNCTTLPIKSVMTIYDYNDSVQKCLEENGYPPPPPSPSDRFIRLAAALPPDFKLVRKSSEGMYTLDPFLSLFA